MAKVMVIGSYIHSLINFRGPLLKTLAKKGHEVIACAPGKEKVTISQLRRIGVTYHPIYLNRTGLNPIKDFFSFINLIQTLRTFCPEIVFSYTIKPVIYGSLAARFMGVAKIFSLITGLGYAFTKKSLKNNLVNLLVCKLYRIALSFNEKVFFQNPDDRALFLQLKLVQKKDQTVLINGSGVDLEYFQPAPLNHRYPVFLLIARLIRDKGILEYVEAARIIKKRYPQTTFRLLGFFDPHPDSISPSQVKNWQDEGIIEYLGEAEDVRPYIAQSNVYVLPSFREGTPRTVLEAMAMGRPVITTNVPGCRETVIEGKNG
ncbi:MAG: glycosyltransferase family 1 protein, partial [Deltaproteobacteria bacterium]